MSASIGNQLTRPPQQVLPTPMPARPALSPQGRWGPTGAPAMPPGPQLPGYALKTPNPLMPSQATPPAAIQPAMHPPEPARSSYGLEHQVSTPPSAPRLGHEATEAFTGHAHDNIVGMWNEVRDRPWLHDAVHAHWGANKHAYDLAQEHGISHRQAAATIAALSPHTDFNQNMDRVQRMMNIVRSHKDSPFDETMRGAARQQIENRKHPALREQGLKELASLPEGAKFRDLKEPLHQALFAKAHSLGDVPASELHSAFNVLKSDDLKEIDKALGHNPSVRSRYNNMIAPDSPEGHVTIDTPAINAAHMKPHVGPSEHADHGLYADAYRRAAGTISRQEGRRYLPREVQSAVGEAVKGLFDQPEHKALHPEFLDIARTQRNPEFGEPVHHVGKVAKHFWNFAKYGVITPEMARRAILNAAGGVSDPQVGR